MEIISFFSFKGGVGRTALLTNIGAYWAARGKVVLLVDMDLSAPGLTFSPLAGEWLDEEGRGLGISDLLDAYYNKGEGDNVGFLPPSKLIRRMDVPDGDVWEDGGRLLLIDAGSPRFSRPTGSEEGILHDIPARTPSASRIEDAERQTLRILGDAMREDLAKFQTDGRKIDYVLIDSRTGLPELVDLSLGLLADRMVLVSGINGQNQRGLELTLDALKRERIPLDQFPAYLGVVFSPVPLADDDRTADALDEAHGIVARAMRPTSAGVPESQPPILHLHYTAGLAVSDLPLVTRQPRSRYAREVKLVARWLEGTPISPGEMEFVLDDLTAGAREKYLQTLTNVGVFGPTGKTPDAQDDGLPNPAADLPPWHWALPREQQAPHQRAARLRDLIKPAKGVELDPETFATKMSWAALVPSEEKQRLLDELPRMKQARVTYWTSVFDEMRAQIVERARTDGKAFLSILYEAEKAWALLINKKPGTGLRRFLADPVDGETLFPAWEARTDYWLRLAHDLLVDLGDQPRALSAIDRAASVGSAAEVAGKLPGLIKGDAAAARFRPALIEKAWTLAPSDSWVKFCILRTEPVLDRVAAEEVVTTLLQSPPGDSDSVKSLIEFIGDWLPRLSAKALPLAEQLVRDHPENGRAFFCLAIALETGSERYQEAEAAYRRSIDLAPKNAQPWNGLGILLANHLGRYEEAEAAYRRSIDLAPKAAYPWHGLGNLLQDHFGRYEEAEAAYRCAIGLDSKMAPLWVGLGDLLADHLGRYEEAETAYRRAIDLDPESFHSWNGLGWLFRVQGNFGQAIQAFDRTVDLERNGSYGRMNRGRLCFLQGDWDAPRADVAEAVRLFAACGPADNHLITAVLLGDGAAVAAAQPRCRDAMQRNSEDPRWPAALLLAACAGHDGAENRDAQAGIVRDRLRSHNEWIGAINDLYDLAGWRPDAREAAREAARALWNLPDAVKARFKDVPKPDFILDRYRPFIEGRSDGAGDPRDLPLWCKDAGACAKPR